MKVQVIIKLWIFFVLLLFFSCKTDTINNNRGCPELNLTLSDIDTNKFKRDLFFINEELDTLIFKLVYLRYVENDSTVINNYNYHKCENALYVGYRHSLYNRLNIEIVAKDGFNLFRLHGRGFGTSFDIGLSSKFDTLIKVMEVITDINRMVFFDEIYLEDGIPTRIIDSSGVIWNYIPSN